MAYTKEQRAEYQREYRKRQRREQVMNTTMPAQAARDLIDCEDEVRRLKRELAARPPKRELLPIDDTGRAYKPDLPLVTPQPAMREMTPEQLATRQPPFASTFRPAPKPIRKKR